MAGKAFEAMAAEIPGVRVMPHDDRITRWSFYNYLLAIDPEAFGGATNEVVCAAMEAEGIPAEVQYPSMNRYELFQPSLSRLPVAVEHADRLDIQRDVVPGGRGGRPARVGLLHGERVPRRRAGASRTPPTPSRRSSATPPNCRRADESAIVSPREEPGQVAPRFALEQLVQEHRPARRRSRPPAGSS